MRLTLEFVKRRSGQRRHRRSGETFQGPRCRLRRKGTVNIQKRQAVRHRPDQCCRRQRIRIVLAGGQARGAHDLNQTFEGVSRHIGERRILPARAPVRPEHDLEVMRPVECKADVGRGGGHKTLHGIVWHVLQGRLLRGGEELKSRLGDRGNQSRLVPEVMIRRGLRNTSAPRDLTQTDRLITSFSGKSSSRLDEGGAKRSVVVSANLTVRSRALPRWLYLYIVKICHDVILTLLKSTRGPTEVAPDSDRPAPQFAMLIGIA